MVLLHAVEFLMRRSTPDGKRHFYLTKARAESIRIMAAEPRTQVEIAKTLEVPRSRIRAWMKELGIPPLSSTEGFKLGRAKSRSQGKRWNRNRVVVGADSRNYMRGKDISALRHEGRLICLTWVQ